MDRMAAFTNRVCPACASRDYMFRARRNIPASAEKGPEVETKYRCRACEHEWKERLPAPATKAG